MKTHSHLTAFSRIGTAFTLIELLVVISIIAILAGIMMPALMGAQERARRIACMSNTKQINLALKSFATDSQGLYPSGLTSTVVFNGLTNGGYLAVGNIYHCNSSKKTLPVSAPLTAAMNSYACAVGDSSGAALNEAAGTDTPLVLDLGFSADALGNLKNQPFSADKGNPHKGDGGNIAYSGGHAIWRKNLDCGADGTNGYLVNP